MFVALPTAGGAEVTVWSALAARWQRIHTVTVGGQTRCLGRPGPLSSAHGAWWEDIIS
jgi:hypothetical protein